MARSVSAEEHVLVRYIGMARAKMGVWKVVREQFKFLFVPRLTSTLIAGDTVLLCLATLNTYKCSLLTD